MQAEYTQRRSLYGGEDGVNFSQEHKGIFFITEQLHLLRGWRPEEGETQINVWPKLIIKVYKSNTFYYVA